MKKTEVKKYIVEETMGDNTVNIKVKFVYNTYMFGKLWNTREEYDPIIFPTHEEAEYYARHVTAPSIEKSLEITGYNQYNDGYYFNNVHVYLVFTGYNDALTKIIYNYEDTIYPKPEPTDYRFLYVQGYWEQSIHSYDMAYNYGSMLKPRERLGMQYFSGFVIKNVMEKSPLMRCYYQNKWEDSSSKKTLKEKFDEFSEFINKQIKKYLDKEAEKRLSKTLISSTETLIDDNEETSVDGIVTINSEYDAARNKIIEDELKRVSEYQNFLKKLIR